MDVDDRWHTTTADGRRIRSDRYGRGKRYLARWRVDGRQYAKAFGLKVEAESHLARVALERAQGTYADPNAGKVTVRAYAEDWRLHAAHRPSTASRVRTILNRHLYPYLGDRPIRSIRPSDVRGWVKHLEATLAPSTVNNIHGVVAGIFATAVDDRVISQSPFARRTGYLPEVHREQTVPPTPEQVTAIVGKVELRYRPLVILAASTGLRVSEAIGLSIDPQMPHRVDLMRGQVHVARSISEGRRWGPPKTKASHRSVPLPEAAKTALAEHLAAFPAVTVELEDDVDRTSRDVALLFTGPRGAPLRRTVFSTRVWTPACAAAGVPGVRFHDLRHFYASLLIADGRSVKTVQARLGHATAAETLDTYSHLWHDDDTLTRAAVDSVFSAMG